MELEKTHEFIVHENKLREIVLRDFTRAGVEQFAVVFQAMVDEQRPFSDTASHRLLIDSSNGTMPVAYAVRKFKTLDIVGWGDHARVAILLQQGIMVTIVGTMMRAYPQTYIRLFTPTERQDAIAWLGS